MLEIQSEKFVQFGVVSAPLKELLNAVLKRIDKYGISKLISVEPICLGDENLSYYPCENLFELHQSELNLFSMKGDVNSLFISNLQDGWHSLFYGASLDLQQDAVWLRSSYVEAAKENYVQNFEVYRDGKIIRSVNLYCDKKWIFHEIGDKMSVESDFDYKNTLIKKRLTRLNLTRVLYEIFPGLSCKDDAAGYKILIRPQSVVS